MKMLATALLLIAVSTHSLSLTACQKSAWAPSTATYPFTLMTLPYSFNFLEPYISSAIVTAHHNYHHQAYVTKLNAYLATMPNLQSTPLVTLNQNAASDLSLQKFAGGDFNHNLLWWELTSPACALPAPTGQLGIDINTAFGNFSNFQSAFQTASAGVFGSGWAWLCLGSNNLLMITTTANQMNPLMTGTCNPVFGSDLWEHAYYLQYMYNKDAYFSNFWNIVDWTQVQYFYDTYVSLGQPIPL